MAGLQNENDCHQFFVTLTTGVPNMLAGLSKVFLSPWFSEPEKNLLTPVSKAICEKKDL